MSVNETLYKMLQASTEMGVYDGLDKLSGRLGCFLDSLISNGFSREEAIVFVRDYLSALLVSSMAQYNQEIAMEKTKDDH